MSYHTGLGQTTTTYTTRQVVYRQPVYYATGYNPYPGAVFTRAETPGQPYSVQFNPKEVEKEVYKEIPQETKEEQESVGTEPQKIVKLKSGLEVPAYIMQRHMARQEAEVRKAEAMANIPPPKYYKIGLFASRQPAKAALYALGLGYICGLIGYTLKH